jgi:hypothetical protein
MMAMDAAIGAKVAPWEDVGKSVVFNGCAVATRARF